MRLFDSHCHLADPKFNEDRLQVVKNMQDTGVVQAMLICDPGDEVPYTEKTFQLTEDHPGFFFGIGVHPHNAKAYNDRIEREIQAFCAEEKNKALGEIGLDYYYDLSPRGEQRDVFARQLDLAYTLGKPCVLHIRDAFGDAMDILRSSAKTGRLVPCQMHCYSGSWETAKECLDMGMVISFSGSVTFKNARRLLETAEKAPIDRILVETDSPYLAPVPMRGKRNEPAYVAYTARFIAGLRNMDEEEFAETARRNSCRFFSIDPEVYNR